MRCGRRRAPWSALRLHVMVLIIAAGLAPAAIARTKPKGFPAAEVFQTNPGNGRYLTRLPELRFRAVSGNHARRGPVVRVDDRRSHQPIWGVGGSITNSSSFLLVQELAPPQRAQVIDQLFGPDGAHLSWIGVTIGGSDFNASGAAYSEDDMPPGQTDPQLKHFSLKNDRNTIAVLRAALHVNPEIKIIARPWSAPAWMKTNDTLTNVGFAGRLKRRYYAVYARYFVKYLEGFRRAGIPIYAITVQNEPVKVPASYEGMRLPARNAGYFVRRYLRPALRKAGLATKIYGIDESWTVAAYGRKESRAARGLDGVAWHCYAGDPDIAMRQFRPAPQVLSECANDLIAAPVPALLTDVFDDGARAAALWNIALTPFGGPVVPPDSACPVCTGIVTVDPNTHQVAYTATYYELAQFGRFLRPGARRISATRLGHFLRMSTTEQVSPGVHDVAFRNPDGSIVLVIYNDSAETERVRIVWRKLATTVGTPAGSTTTLRWSAARVSRH